jgi:two-component system cell cycle sensor histidine kinase/response regulator CckA
VTRGPILVVEDEEQVRMLLVRLLTKQGFTVVHAENGRRGLELARTQIDDLALVITDMVMPEMGGTAMLHELRALRPDLPAIFMTGYTQDDVPDSDDLNALFLEKPFTPAAFLATVGRVTGAA